MAKLLTPNFWLGILLIIAAIVLLMILPSCHASYNGVQDCDTTHFNTVTYQGHDYIYYEMQSSYSGSMFTHSGSCRLCNARVDSLLHPSVRVLVYDTTARPYYHY